MTTLDDGLTHIDIEGDFPAQAVAAWSKQLLLALLPCRSSLRSNERGADAGRREAVLAERRNKSSCAVSATARTAGHYEARRKRRR